MRDSDPITSAAFFDFLQDFEDDSRAGELRSLTTYLARYPEAESEIAAEYVRRTGSQSLLTEEEGEDEEESVDAPGASSRYRLIRPLGQGGQGTVYLAEDKRLGREVALKQLDGRWITKTRRLRFQREAEVVARVEHPSIAEVLDADFESATPFLVMRYVKGTDLAGLIRADATDASGALSIPPTTPEALDALLRYFEETARALHAAHEAGVVHRDVKPGNLMVAQDGSPCVLDFGLAVEADGESLTREGEGLGTPEYMAPEQVSSSAGPVDRKTDVHALGLVMYEALTGRRPFVGSTVHEIHQAVLDHERPRLTGSFGRHGSDLGIVVATAMERDPTRRYASALALAEDIRRVRSTQPIHARPAGPWLKFRRWVQREPALSTAVFVLIASLSIGLALAILAIGERDRLIDVRDGALTEKDRALNYARAQFYLARSEERVSAHPSAALALAIHATRLHSSAATRSGLYRPLAESRLERRFHANGANRLTEALFSPSERWIATSPDGRETMIWDREGNVVEHVDLGLSKKEPVIAMAWVSEPDHLTVTTKLGRTATVKGDRVTWQAAEPGAGRQPRSDGQTLEWSIEPATQTGDAAIVIPSSGPAKRPVRLTLPSVEGVDVSASPDGQRIACTLPTGAVYAWDARTGETLMHQTGDFVPVSMQWSADGSRILTSTRSANAYLWRVDPAPEMLSLREDGPAVLACALLRNGSRALIIDAAGHMTVQATGSSEPGQPPPGGAPPATRPRRAGSLVWEHESDTRYVRAFVSEDGATWVTVGEDGAIAAWAWTRDKSEPTQLGTTQVGSSGEPVDLYVDPAHSSATWRTEGGAVHTWRFDDGAQPAALEWPEGADVTALALGGEGLTALGDATGRIWLTDGEPLAAPVSGPAPPRVLALAFSPDGRYLAAGYLRPSWPSGT